MNYRIGIIGATQSVERIMAVSHDFEDGIKFLPFPFENEKDIETIIKKNKRRVDGWLFSGPLPYNIAKDHFQVDDTAAYCKSIGAGFYINCMQIAYEHRTPSPRISVDMHESIMSIEKTIEETQIPMENVFIKYYGHEYTPEEITAFHMQLWRSGKTDGAITALRTVYNALKKKKVPVYYLVLTKAEIYQSLQYITEKVKTSYFKTTQVGSVIITIGQYYEVIEKSKSSAMLQTLEWKLKGLLMPLCERLNGYLIEKGQGVYEIFSSRGVIEKELEMIRDTVKQMEIILNFTVNVKVGVGFGETVSNAEFNAYRALRNSGDKKFSGPIIIKDDGKIVEFSENEQAVSYDYYSDDSTILKKLHEAAVGIKTFRKIEATVTSLQTETFTVLQLANRLGVTEQNIRRILGALTQVGLADVVGEEAAGRGRPGKIYKLNI